mgnify:CR=1 FL=1
MIIDILKRQNRIKIYSELRFGHRVENKEGAYE